MLKRLWRALPLALGLLLLALFVWFAGPYFGFGRYKPLESWMARLALIVVILASVALAVALKRRRANQASDKLVAAVVEQASAQPAPSAELVQLRERFEEAVAVLKEKRRSGHTLYELPWYVIIGAPGSGKTTALVNSGLHFPLEQRSGRGALRGIGGTRNCDWWFTDEAVLLDTAGRYTTQDSDASADSSAWREFLVLLKKYRKRRPLNGVILTVSATDLLADGSIEAHTAAVRSRLNELNRELKIQLPVYLTVTKCDLVAGFTEYFGDLTQDGRAQVWGVTFPYEQTLKGEASSQFEHHFDRLIARLNERLFGRIEEDREARRRTMIFGFPQQMAALRGRLGEFLAGVFRSTRFDQQVLLRGVYFTSGTQEGTPIDRLLGALGRRLGAASEAVQPGSRGKAYFIERLLKDVMFAESGLAGVNRRFEVQMAAAQLAAYIAMAVVAVVGVVLWTVSYSRNRSYLQKVEAAVASVTPAPTDADSLDAAIPRLNALRSVVQAADEFAADVPFAMRWGLYQGGALGDAARDAYSRELDEALLPRVATRFRQRLLDYAAEPEKLYPYLKGYLMLGDPSHLDKDWLRYLADLEWPDGGASDSARGQEFGQHFQSLLEYRQQLRRIEIDPVIVAQAQSTLRQASMPVLVYSYVRIRYADDVARALRLDEALGLGADRVLRRAGAGLADPVPSIYTKPVFEEIVAKAPADLDVFISEYWVWGDARPAIASAQLMAAFLDVYEKDYIAAWDRILREVQPIPSGGLADTKEALAILSGSASPLRALLKAVYDHTYLVKPPEAAQPAERGGVGERLSGVFKGGQNRAAVAAVPPGTQVTKHFEEFHRLVAGDNPPIGVVIQKLQELQKTLAPIGTGVGERPPGDPASVNDVGQLAIEIRREAAPLPPTIAGIVTQVADRAMVGVRGGLQTILENRYQQDVVRECRLIVADSYPFVPTSAANVTLVDFGRLFGFGGLYDNFFKVELSKLVETSRSPWSWLRDASGATVGGSAQMLRRVEAARRIRDLYFPTGSMEPELRFTITPENLDRVATGVTLEIDGQQVVYRHTPPRPGPMKWPGPKPGLVVITFEGPGGSRPFLTFQGAWAWLRFVDASNPQRTSKERLTLTSSAGAHQAQLLLEAPSIRNPYGDGELQDFRCE